ncbi:hypothetical protein MKX01_042124 [Papaver californicum]|nr:hypothetical protein MKX01_042124 [Papaver californicum]
MNMADNCLGPPLICKSFPLPFSIPSRNPLLLLLKFPDLFSLGPWLTLKSGTAFNGVVEEMKKLTTRVAHVLPVSDDGGSTAEIVRVLGGPAVGDIRSRCLRLSDGSTSEALAVRRLLGHRLPLDGAHARSECLVLNGAHFNYRFGKPNPLMLLSLLPLQCGMILLKESTLYGMVYQNPTEKPSEPFWLISKIRSSGGQVNCFVSAMEALETFSLQSLVLPVISTNDRLTLGCELWDGTIIRGQNEISHPSIGSTQPVDKKGSSVPALPSRIKRIFYMSSEGRNLLLEVFPTVNPSVLEQLSKVDCIVYAMGSLFTSVCPSLVLVGTGEVISSRSCLKVFLLNGSHDRETSGLSASGFITAIADALNRTYGDSQNCLKNPPSQYVNALLVPKDGQIPVDVQSLSEQGIFHVVTVDSILDPKVGIIFNPKSLIQALAELITEYNSAHSGEV